MIKLFYVLCSLQFSQNEEFKQRLVSTYPKTLGEASPIDRFWGIGLSEDDKRAWNKRTWRGRNMLGEVLTKVRNTIMTSNLKPANPLAEKKGTDKHDEIL